MVQRVDQCGASRETLYVDISRLGRAMPGIPESNTPLNEDLSVDNSGSATSAGLEPSIVHAGSSMALNHRPGAEWVLKDIDRSVDYRRKYYEYSITIATALLAFSISFPPTLTAVHYVFLVRVAWIALGVSILCGVSIHFAWSKFFISFRNFDNKGEDGKGARNRKRWTFLRKLMEWIQFLTLLVGVLGMSVFAGGNYRNIAPHTNESNPPVKAAQSPR